MTSRIVVTGSAGMLGQSLVARLTGEGYEVRGVDLRWPDTVPRGARHTVGDINDEALLKTLCTDAAAVVHCASGLPSYPEKEIRRISVDGTRTVFEAARAAGVPRVVHVSSTAVYGLPTQVPTPESCPRAPVDAYSRAKVESEEIAEKYRAEGLCVTILRPKTFLGPGRMGLFAMLFEWADEGRNFPALGGGDVVSQMLAVDDLATVVSTVLTAPVDDANDTYNIAAAEYGTLRETFQAVLDAAGHGKHVVSVPVGPALPVLRLLERTRLSPVYRRLAHKLLADSYVSIDKAHQRLGFTPEYSDREAILQSWDWWRQQRADGRGHSSSGRTHRDAWRQGALSLTKALFR